MELLKRRNTRFLPPGDLPLDWKNRITLSGRTRRSSDRPA